MKRLLLFTRYPRPGKVKTRMIPVLGPQGAACLHRQMTEQVINNLRPLLRNTGNTVQLQIHYCEGSEQEMVVWLGNEFKYIRQNGNDLGQRMQRAFEQSWQEGSKHTLILGSDCPSIDAPLLQEGLEALQKHQVVLGPAADGGYYLIGLQPFPLGYATFFQDISWGTSQVLQQTKQQAALASLSVFFLPELHDIDRPEDLVHFPNYSYPE